MKKLLILALLLWLPSSVAFADTVVVGSTSGWSTTTDCSTTTTDSSGCWDSDDNILYIGDGAAAVAIGGTGVTTVTDTTDTSTWVLLSNDQTGALAPHSDGGLTYNAGTGVLTATGFAGPINGTIGATTPAAGTFTSVTVSPSADPTVTFTDSDTDAAGTAKIYGNSAGSQDVIMYIGVEDSTGESTHYIEVDGVSETIDLLKPVVISGLQFKLPSSDADPTATAGYLRHDSTISNFTNGGLVYYNGAAIKQVVDMTTATASACTDDQVVAYDADNDLWYCKADSTGAGSLGANLASTTNDLTSDNNALQFVANSEDLVFTASANLWTLSSTTGATVAITPDTTITGDLTVGGADITLKTDGVKLTAANGALTILGLGDGQDEDVKIDLNTTANTIEITSPASSATAVDFNTLNLVTTGTISGATPSTTDADGDTLDAAEQYGYFHWATGAGTWNLAGAAAGMSFCIYSTTAAAIVINPDDSDIIVLNGTALSAGDSITSASAAGDFICLIAKDAEYWYTVGRSGTWTDTN